MITIRKSKERGHVDFGWLDTYHTFSFGEYSDPKFKGFGKLRVINEDRIQAGKGFPTHAHWNMEIVTYVLSGALAHKDSMGNGSVIQAGDVQYMSAGTGVEHSEFNHSNDSTTHLLQIWILTAEKGSAPRYAQNAFSRESKKNQWRLIVSEDGRDGSIAIRQSASLYASILEKGESLSHSFSKSRAGWLQVARGSVKSNQQILEEGDGASIVDESELAVAGLAPESEILLFDLPPLK